VIRSLRDATVLLPRKIRIRSRKFVAQLRFDGSEDLFPERSSDVLLERVIGVLPEIVQINDHVAYCDSRFVTARFATTHDMRHNACRHARASSHVACMALLGSRFFRIK
jgi:hypothetical protein